MNARATLDLAPLLADEPTGLEAGVSLQGARIHKINL